MGKHSKYTHTQRNKLITTGAIALGGLSVATGTANADPGVPSNDGVATFFGGTGDAQPMACGASTPPTTQGVALWGVPCGTQVTITSKVTGKSVTAPVVDRGPGSGPMASGVVIDLLPGTWDALGVPQSAGRQAVHWEIGTGSTPAPAPAPASNAGSDSPAVNSPAWKAIEYAKAHISSAPYVLGGNGPVNFDCSGLTSQAWKAAGVDFTSSARTSQMQANPSNVGPQATAQTRATLKPGDLLIFTFPGDEYEGHVGLYTGPIGPGGADMIDTATRHPGGGVNWSTLATRGGTVSAITRPAPFVPASGTPSTPKPPASGKTEGSHRKTYTVVKGDWLMKIAREKLGREDRWKNLYAMNKKVIGSDPDLILPGQVLHLPGSSVTQPVQTPEPPKPPAPPAASADWVAPLKTAVIQVFMNPGPYTLGYHTGIDMAGSTGDPVVSPGNGVVVASDPSAAYGNNVQIKFTDGRYGLFAHLSSKAVAPGDTVKAGQVIGNVGSTGNSTGPHLHFEIRIVPSFGAGNFLDPVKWMADHGVTL